MGNIMNRTLSALGVTAVAAAFVVSACGTPGTPQAQAPAANDLTSPATKSGTLTVVTKFADPQYAPYFVAVAKAYEAANPGVKVDLQNLWNPSKPNSAAQKLNLAFKNPNVHSRAFINYGLANGNLDAVLDVTAGHEGFLVGGEAGYDVQKAAITRYSLGLGYQTAAFTASLVGTQNLSVIAASYYQKVNSSVEVGTKAAYDVQNGKPSGLEVASKYKLDPLTFAKVS